jgi:signal transduction histidine kinase
MPEDKTHALSSVHCFLEDNKGFIWMTTNNGLFQCATNDLYDYAAGKKGQVYHHYYGKESGLKSSEFNGGCTPSGLKLDDGRFAFPSMDGVVLFHPDSIKPVLPTGKLFMEQILLDGVPVQKNDLSEIPPSFKRLELTVSSPYFGNPRNLNIQYNIGGLDDRWYSLDENDHIVLNRLKYGHYKLRIRNQSGFGTGNYITTELPFYVAPFFYQNWWFRIAIGVGIALLIVAIVRVRYQYLIRQRNQLEAEVKDRTSALVYNNKLMEKLTVMIAHDLKSPLHFLSKVTGHLRKNVQQENLQGIDRTSSEIKNTADHVYQFVEAFNLWASSFTEGFTVNKTSFALDELLQELALFFKEMLDANGNRLFAVTPTHYMLDTDRELLKVILRNIIDNANKHTRACDISISVHAETGQDIAITITDTGEGMSTPVLKRIQDRIAQASTAAGIERNSRMGYQMIIDFATRLEAKLDVQSEPGKGTFVTLHIKGKINEKSSSRGLAEQIVSAG